MEHLDEYNYVKDYENYHGHRVYIGYKSKHKAYKGYKPKYKAYKGYKGYKSSYKGYKAYPSMRKEYKEGNGMECVCCSKHFRTSKEERLAFLNCGYYSPSWMVQSNGIEPETLEKWNLDPMDNDHFVCFDCQADIEASQARNYNNSLLSPMGENRKKKVKEDVFNDDQIMLADEFLQSTGNYFDVQDKRKSGYSGVVGRIIVVANPSNKSLVKRDAEVFAASKGLEVYSCSDFLEPGKFDIEFAKPGSAKSISDFYSKGCKYESKENKMKERRRIAEDRYNSVEDELRDIEYGGYDEFEMDDEYGDPYLAKAIHKNAQDAGLSDLDYVNREEALESIEDDWAYDLETQDYYSDFAEVVNSRTVQELYDEEAAELADNGYYVGPYGSRITNGKDLLAEMMESWVRYMEDEIPCPPSGYRYDGVDRIQHMLDAAVKYANNPVTPKVARFYECLVVLAEEYNEVVANVFGNDPEVPTLTIPSTNVKESMLRKCKSLREKLNK